jgi:hypothetical protein
LKKKLFSNLAASWMVSPIWAVIITAFGLGSHEGILAVLYIATITIPFQILLNDCIGVGNAVRDDHRFEWRAILILAAQWLTTMVVIASTANGSLNHVVAFGLVAASAATTSNALSFRTTIRYYSALRRQIVSTKQSTMLGLVPGVSTLLYSILFIATTLIAETKSTETVWIALGFVVIGPFAQHAFAARQIPLISDASQLSTQKVLANDRSSGVLTLLTVGGIVTALSAAAVWARDEVSGDLGGTAALGITALNLVGTVINTLTRASNLANPARRYWPLLTGAGTLAGAAAALLWPTFHVLSLVFFCLCCQIFLAALIEFSRRALGWGAASV